MKKITLGISFKFTEERVAAIKTIGGWWWNKDEKVWLKEVNEADVPAECAIAKALNFTPFIYSESEVTAI